MINSTMGKTTDETKLFVRFLKEKGIKYSYAEETLRFSYIKKYERKEFSRFLSDEVGGDLLKFLDSIFSRKLYSVIHYSFSFVNTKKTETSGTKWKWNGMREVEWYEISIPHK